MQRHSQAIVPSSRTRASRQLTSPPIAYHWTTNITPSPSRPSSSMAPLGATRRRPSRAPFLRLPGLAPPRAAQTAVSRLRRSQHAALLFLHRAARNAPRLGTDLG